MKAHEWYGTPKPSPVLKKKAPACGHDKYIVHKNRKQAWCWDCQGPVKLIKVKVD